MTRTATDWPRKHEGTKQTEDDFVFSWFRGYARLMGPSLALLCFITAVARPEGRALRAQQDRAPLSVVATIAGPADLVQVHGRFAYVTAGPLLRVVDVSDPSIPKQVGGFTFPAKIWAFTVSGSLVYAAVGWSGLVVLDLSDPVAPRLRGSFKTLGEAWGVAFTGGKAIVANQMSGVDVLDVTNPDTPVLVGNYFTEGYARDVATWGALAYVIDQPTGFSVLDVSKRGPPAEVSSQQSAGSPMVIAVAQPSGDGAPKIACVVGAGRSPQAGWLQVYDVSDPRAPVKAAAFKTPGRAVRVAVQGNTAYVADAFGLQVVDLSSPTTPSLAHSYQTVGPARDVAVAGPFVYVVAGEAGREGAGVVILRRDP